MGIRLKNGLTPKQAKLVQVVAGQIMETGNTNMTQAGLQVYNSKNPEIARNTASETIHKPAVKEALEQALEAVGFSLQENISELATIARSQPKFITGDVKLRALETLLKLRTPNNQAPGGNNYTFNFHKMDFKEAKEEYEKLKNTTTAFLDEADN